MYMNICVYVYSHAHASTQGSKLSDTAVLKMMQDLDFPSRLALAEKVYIVNMHPFIHIYKSKYIYIYIHIYIYIYICI